MHFLKTKDYDKSHSFRYQGTCLERQADLGIANSLADNHHVRTTQTQDKCWFKFYSVWKSKQVLEYLNCELGKSENAMKMKSVSIRIKAITRRLRELLPTIERSYSTPT